MNIINYSNDTNHNNPCVATVGFFDGVHRGHRFLIKRLVETARAQGIESTVMTFDCHPRQVLHSDYQPQLLSSLDEKIMLLSKTDVDNCVVLPFNEAMSSLSARQFMQQVLVDRLSVKTLITGYDNRFGHNRSEGFDDYVRYGADMGLSVVKAPSFVLNGVNVSSSVIRSFLQEGETEMAEMCLGYPYTIIGSVVHGEHLGTDLGFPTANISPNNHDLLIPAPGVYAVKVHLPDGEEKRGMMNIGTRPTFEGNKMSLEVNILRFTGDLYGKQIAVSFVHRLRSEQKFVDTAQLVKQLKKDATIVDELFDKDNNIQ